MIGECPTDADLERLMAEQLTPEEKQAIDVHIASCSSCQLRLERQSTWRGVGVPGATDPATHGVRSDDESTILGAASGWADGPP